MMPFAATKFQGRLSWETLTIQDTDGTLHSDNNIDIIYHEKDKWIGTGFSHQSTWRLWSKVPGEERSNMQTSPPFCIGQRFRGLRFHSSQIDPFLTKGRARVPVGVKNGMKKSGPKEMKIPGAFCFCVFCAWGETHFSAEFEACCTHPKLSVESIHKRLCRKV